MRAFAITSWWLGICGLVGVCGCDFPLISECDTSREALGCPASAKIAAVEPRLDRRGGDFHFRFTNADDTKRLLALKPLPDIGFVLKQDDIVVVPAVQPGPPDDNGIITVPLSPTDLMRTHAGAAEAELTIRRATGSAPLVLYTSPKLTERTGAGKRLSCKIEMDKEVVCWAGLRPAEIGHQLVFAEGTDVKNLAFNTYKNSGDILTKSFNLISGFAFDDGKEYFINKYAFFSYINGSLYYRKSMDDLEISLDTSSTSPAFDPASGLVAILNNGSLIIYHDIQNPTIKTKSQFIGASLLSSGDLDGDGRSDIVALTASELETFVAPKNQDDPFNKVIFANSIRSQFSIKNKEDPISAIAIGDIDQDQRPDLLLATSTGLHYAPMIGVNRFGDATPVFINDYQPAKSLYWLDIDGDKRSELIVVTADKVRIFTNS